MPLLPSCLLLIAIMVLAGCAQRRQPAPLGGGFEHDVQLAGVYQYQTVLDRAADPGAPASNLRENVSGQIRVEESDGAFSGEITATGRSPFPITSARVSRDEVIIEARDTDGGPVTLRLSFNGDTFVGQWITSNGFGSPIRGVRRQ